MAISASQPATSTSTSSSKPSLSATSTSANNWDPLKLWLDSVSVDVPSPSSFANEQFMHMDTNNSTPSPSTPNATAFFQFCKYAPAPASLNDFTPFDFSGSMFTSNIAMTTPSASSSTYDSSSATLTFTQELQKSTDFLSMEVSTSATDSVYPHYAPKHYVTATPRQQTTGAKKLRGSTTTTVPVPAEAKLQVRKVKQRGYERTYRGRLRNKRAEDEALWKKLEAQLRTMLAEKQAVHAHETPAAMAANDLEREYFELVHQLRALQEENAFWVAVVRWIDTLNMWGGETESSRSNRYQINAMPKLSGYPTFTNFTWE